MHLNQEALLHGSYLIIVAMQMLIMSQLLSLRQELSLDPRPGIKKRIRFSIVVCLFVILVSGLHLFMG